jgi:hypothetical protein
MEASRTKEFLIAGLPGFLSGPAIATNLYGNY